MNVNSGVRDALDSLSSHEQERIMLAHMTKMRLGSGGGQATDPRVRARREEERKQQQLVDYQNRPGLSLTHIRPDGSMTKEKLKSQGEFGRMRKKKKKKK